MKIIHIFRPRYHPKIVGHTLKNKQKISVCIHKIIQLIIMPRKVKIKDRSHRYDITNFGVDLDTNTVNIKSVSV